MNFDLFRKFVKQNYQIFYSLALIVIIPLALLLHTYSMVTDMQSNMDAELQGKALLMENIIETIIIDDSKLALVQEKIDRIISGNSEIQTLTIAVPENDDFKITAAKDKNLIGQSAKETQSVLVWHENRPFAHLIIENSRRFWEITNTVKNSNGEKQGLITVRLSLENIDSLTYKTIKQAYVLLIIIVAIILLLVINNTKLFQQVNLYYKLKEIDIMKDEFISTVSHELRTPITAIRGYLYFIFDDSRRVIDDVTKKDLENIRFSSDLLSKLVDDILEVARLEQGKVKLVLDSVDIKPVINEVISELKIKAQEKKLKVIYQESGILPNVLADVIRLKQILINLIDNAIKYTPQGQIIITSIFDDKDKKIKIKVADTGLGMSAKVREGLFQKFYRIRTKETADISGTGLGLWITKNLVERMGGEIYVDSIEGTGSVFTVILPIASTAKEKK